MKKKAITLIIILAAISSVGIVFTQLYWVSKAFELKEEQFDNSVRVAMKSVLNQLLDHKNDSVFREHIAEVRCRKLKLDVTDIIKPKLLDSLMQEELGSMVISRNYHYALYNKQNGRFIEGEYEGVEVELMNTKFQFSVASLYKPGDYYLAIYFPGKTYHVLQQMEIWLVLSILFVIVLIVNSAFVIFNIIRHKKLSEIKNDFINNMTHEFKTPIATSSLAAEMLLRPEIENEPMKIKKYANVILDENHRLQSQVEQILQLAALEIGSLRYRLFKVDIHQLINNVLDSFEIRIRKDNVDLQVKLDAEDHFILGDKEHLQNVFYNLIDNALKYTTKNPKIKIKSWNVNNGVMIRVEDNGIGIRKEHQKEIFKNLYRVPTGNIYKTRGFGLGLYYVKTVIDHHNGRIGLNSQAGAGSSFNVFLPFKNQ